MRLTIVLLLDVRLNCLRGCLFFIWLAEVFGIAVSSWFLVPIVGVFDFMLTSLLEAPRFRSCLCAYYVLTSALIVGKVVYVFMVLVRFLLMEL